MRVIKTCHLVLHLNMRLLDLVLRLVAENLAFLAHLIRGTSIHELVYG